MKQRGFIILPVIIVIVLIGITGFFVYKNTQFKNVSIPSPSQINNLANEQFNNLASPTPRAIVSKIEKTNKIGWNKYTNLQGKFSILFPDKLQLINEEPAIPERKESGTISLCDEQRKDGLCYTGQVHMLYGIPSIDGKGGGCIDEEKYLTILGKERYVCVGKDFYGGIFINHPNNYSEIGISIEYRNTLTQTEALEILNSLEFIQ